ncbi:thiol:disulfide interchange protein TlpA [Microvirga guangxiensis]|uniref:Thiol-disulfide isomerase or thioredoxin n=1 Tax=Microvirga guangxiensis TaxID=549386 RepID=A0A1G5H5X0_9HYPH|nr:TlpA disulfide reductase family protein [Microvirga guangxiensis]SCY58919.1 Thiol-disulfide isomerase or thioredoxin [Microvirga guangxiensis]
MSNAPEIPKARNRSWVIGLAALALVGAGAAWYGWSHSGSQVAAAGECRASTAVTERLDPLAKGELAALGVSKSPKPAPVISFAGSEGQPMSLADFKGKTILVNLWATWCVPCREEMPALDKLEAEFGGSDFQVVAINVDTRNTDKPKAWLQENGIGKLAYYADPSGKLLQVLQKSGHVVGLPTTFMVDASGCEIALLKGPAEWASPDAMTFVRTALGRT